MRPGLSLRFEVCPRPTPKLSNKVGSSYRTWVWLLKIQLCSTSSQASGTVHPGKRARLLKSISGTLRHPVREILSVLSVPMPELEVLRGALRDGASRRSHSEIDLVLSETG